MSVADTNWSSKSVAVKWSPATMAAARASLASTSSSDLLRLLLSLVHVRKILYAQMSEDIRAILDYCLAPASANATKWIRVIAAILKQAGNAGTGLALERPAASTDANLATALTPADEFVDLIVRKLASSASIDALAAVPPRRFLPHESCYLAPELRPGGSAASSTLLPPLNTSLSDFRTHAKSLNGANVSANNHAAALALQSQFALLNPHCSVRIPISFDVVIPKDETEELHAHAQPMMHVHQPSASPPPVSAAKASAGAAAAFFPSSSSSSVARPSGPVPLSRGTSSLFSTRPTTNQPAPTISASAALAAIGGGGGAARGPVPIPMPIPGTAAAAAGGFAKRSAIKMLDAAEANLSLSAAGAGAGGHAAKKARPSIGGPAVVPMISLPGTTSLQATSAPLTAKAEREREREAARAAKQREKEEKEAAKEAAKAEKAREKEAKQKEKEAKEQERADKKLQAILDKQSKEEAKAAKAAAKAAAAAAAAAALTGGSNSSTASASQPPPTAAQPAVASSFPAPDYAASTPALAVSSLPPSQQQQLALALGGTVPPQLLQALMTPQTPADQQMLAMMAAWGQMQQQQAQAQAQVTPANVVYAPSSSLALPAVQPSFASYGSISSGAGSYSLPVQATTLATALSTSSASSALAEFPPPPPMDSAPSAAATAMDTSDHSFPPPPPPATATVTPASSAAQLSGLINVGLLHQTPTVSAPVSGASSAAFFPPPPPLVAPATVPVAAIDPAAVSTAAAAAPSVAAPAPAPAPAVAASAPVDVAHILSKSNRVTPSERDLITSFLHHLPFDPPFGAINDTYSILLHEEETADGWRETTTFEITSFAQGSWRKIKRRKKAKQAAAATAAATMVPAAQPAETAPAALVPPAADSEMPD